MHTRIFAASVALCVVLACSPTAGASSTLRIGSQVLTVGDSAARVTKLLGKPAKKTRARHAGRASGRSTHRVGRQRVPADEARAEKWQYQRGDHLTTVTMLDGKVRDIDDHRI